MGSSVGAGQSHPTIDCLESMPTTSLAILSKHCLPLASGHVVIQSRGRGGEGGVHETEDVCFELALAARSHLICRFFKLDLLPVVQGVWGFASRQLVNSSHLLTKIGSFKHQKIVGQQQ